MIHLIKTTGDAGDYIDENDDVVSIPEGTIGVVENAGATEGWPYYELAWLIDGKVFPWYGEIDPKCHEYLPVDGDDSNPIGFAYEE